MATGSFPRRFSGAPSPKAGVLVILGLAVIVGVYVWTSYQRQQEAIRQARQREAYFAAQSFKNFVFKRIGDDIDRVIQAYGFCPQIDRCQRVASGLYNRDVNLGPRDEPNRVYMYMMSRYNGVEPEPFFDLYIYIDATQPNGDLRVAAPRLQAFVDGLLARFNMDRTLLTQCPERLPSGRSTYFCSVRDNEVAGRRLNTGQIGFSRRSITLIRRIAPDLHEGAWLEN